MEALILWGFIIGFYFLPSGIAAARKKHNILAISMLNTLLGWTFVGWVAALVWACLKDKEVSV